MNILVLLRENLVIFLCDCLEHIYYFSIFQPFSIHSSFFYCDVLKKIKASSEIFQQLTCRYHFVLAAFMPLNIVPFVILFLVDIVK